jgi:hypothetical protein
MLDNWFDKATKGPWTGLKHYDCFNNPITQGRFIKRFRKLRLISDFIPYFLVGFQSLRIQSFFHAFIIIKIVLCMFFS